MVAKFTLTEGVTEPIEDVKRPEDTEDNLQGKPTSVTTVDTRREVSLQYVQESL